MNAYTVAKDRAALAGNLGIEIMASKYEALDGTAGRDSEEGYEFSYWMKTPSGELLEFEADPETQLSGPIHDDDDGEKVTCPACGHNFCTVE